LVPTNQPAKNFIRQILVLDPHKRPTSAEALEHPWMLSNAQSSSALQTFSSKMTAYNKKRGKAK
jgi:serine/threonine protein kinase